MNEKNQEREKQERNTNPEALLKSYFAKQVEGVQPPPYRGPRIIRELCPSGASPGPALNLARIAAALFLCLGCLNLYTGIGPKPLLSDEIARIYREQDLKEKVETAFISAHTFLNTYFYNRNNNTQGEKQ
jgi:hypothetical protein